MLSDYKSDKVLEKLPIPRAERVAKEDIAETLKIMTTGFDDQENLGRSFVDLETGKKKKKVGLDSSYIVRLPTRDDIEEDSSHQSPSEDSMDLEDDDDFRFDAHASISSNKNKKRKSGEIVFQNMNPVYMHPTKKRKMG
jgi:hypothetical protein